MGKCDGYCRGDELQEQHGQAIAQAVSLLEGRFKDVQKDLAQEMERAAPLLSFNRILYRGWCRLMREHSSTRASNSLSAMMTSCRAKRD